MDTTPPAANSPIAFRSEQVGANLPPLAERDSFALWHYLKEAYRIIVWNEDAVQRTKDDPLAVAFGVCFWVFTNTLIIVMSHSIFRGRFVLPSTAVLAAVLPIQVFAVSVVSIARLWIVHLVATQFCGGDGQFIQILRPLSLASLIQLPIAVFPIIFAVLGFGSAVLTILALSAILIGLANAAVTVFVFDAVDQMPQLTAFITSVIASIVLNFALQYIVQSLRH
jgi:hypothetical protein